ncbi:MAG: FG-GAP-like repeat-containing protein, partial [Bacteroidales bacterium]|nr:FG-GAP-like repeat-containing protein [Bacteroidales bacterium]
MKTSIRAAAALMTAALALCTAVTLAQNVNHGESFELNSTLNANQSHEYTANSRINLNTGFLYEPVSHKHATMEIDPYGIYPPESGLTGGPNPGDTGVVGALGGTVDVGMMGAAVYTIPIELPAGINGMQPSLAITYNSQAGNGLLGWGWDLAGISCIERTGQTRYHDGAVGAVTLNDTTDRFMLDGKRLIAVANHTDSVEYKTEQDEMSKIMAYFRLEQIGGGLFGPVSIKVLDHFVVWKANGIKMEYGTSNDTQVKLQESLRACCWLLHRATDRNGNYIEYHYTTSNTGFKLAYIDYTGNLSSLPVEVPAFRVSFSYDSRPDIDLFTIGQNTLKRSDLLGTLSINKRIGNQYSELSRYSFEYHHIDASNGYFYTRLKEIHLSSGCESLNPTTIIWSQQSGYYASLSYKGLNTPGHTDAFLHSIKFPGDFNGDGYTDVIVTKPDIDNRYTWAEVYLNQGGENAARFDYVTGIQLNDSVEWIHIADFNGDGKDDFLVSDKQRRHWPYRDLLTMNVYLSSFNNNTLSFTQLPQLGPYKIKRNYVESILIGDYLGIGSDCIIIQASMEDEDHPGQFQYDKAYCFVCSSDETEMTAHQFNDYLPSLRHLAADFDGDGAAEIMYLTGDRCHINKLHKTANGNYYYVESSNSAALDDSYDCYLGDFNGDGKKDVLSCHLNGNNEPVWQINLSGSEGMLDPTYIIDDFGLGYLGSNHHFNLKVHHENWLHLQVADFNGDGYDDIKHPYQHGGYYDQYYFGPVNETGNYVPFSGKKRLYAVHSPHSNLETCLGCFRGKEVCDDLGDEEIYYLTPALDVYAVNGIVDGMGNWTNFTFDYLMQKMNSPSSDTLFYLLDRNQENLVGHVTAMALPTKAVKTIRSYNVCGKPVSTSYRYGGILYHTQGRGFLGFTNVTSTESVNASSYGTGPEDTAAIREQHYSLQTSSQIVHIAPSLIQTFSGNGTLLSETSYENTAYVNSRSENNKVFFPVVTKVTTDYFDPNGTGLLKRDIADYFHNSDGTGSQYNNFVSLGVARKGVTTSPGVMMINGCDFRSVDSIVYYNHSYATWTLNRPHVKTSTLSRTGKPDVTNSHWIEYLSADSYLPSRIYDVPGGVSNQNPLKLQTDLEYYPEGNLMRKTLRVPNGQLDEQQKVFEYEYGPDGQHRLVASETVSSGNLSYSNSYAYDEYDRVDTLTGANGLATTFHNDAFGIITWTTNADGTRTCSAKRWAQGHPLAPSNSSYYVWTRSSDGVQSLVFYHRTGAEMRSVTYGLRGEPVFTDRQYDHRGRLAAVSEPYKEGETARWTTYGYDNLDRLTTVTTPDTTCTATAYDGFRTETAVTTTQGLTQESAVTVNAMGWTVRSDNADGSYVTFDHYADGLMATATVNGNTSTMVTATYDDARRRTTLTDPDYGTLTTTYDAYGRLKRSISPRELSEQTGTENFYDGFDRLIRTAEGLGNTRTDYSYNETGVLKGALDSVVFKKQGGAFIQRVAYAYDSLARLVRTTEQTGASTYITMVQYDGQSRVGRIVYPTGVAVRYGYSHGYLKSVTDDDGLLLWKTNEMDASGLLLEAQLGNGAVTSHTYDTLTHRLTSIVTTKNLQNLSYGYDKFGNLASRKDNKKNLEETFTYDDMNRLTGVTLKRPSGQDLHCTMTYDALGRMTSREAVTASNGIPQVTSVFSQPVFDATKVHALASATTAEGVFPSASQTVTYTGFDKVSMVKQGKDSLCYAYGYDRQRILMEEHFDNTLRTKRYVGNCEFVTKTEGNMTVEYSNTYLTGPYGVFAVVQRSGGFTETYYVLKDN